MSIIVTAKTIEKAIAEGLNQLNAKLEEVDINVLNEGGMFKKAKVEMSLASEKVVAAEKKENKKEPKKAKTQETAQNEEAEVSEEKTSKKAEVANETAHLAKTWLEGLIYAYNINATVNVEVRKKEVYANIEGENLGILIGYHGEAMEAIGHLLNTYVFNKIKNANRVFLDVSGYRAKRIEELKVTAQKLAKKVVENKRRYKLDPMNSFERRVVHEELSNVEHITTHSEGTEPNRYLIIEYTE